MYKMTTYREEQLGRLRKKLPFITHHHHYIEGVGDGIKPICRSSVKDREAFKNNDYLWDGRYWIPVS